MTYTADYLIGKRQEKWLNNPNIEKDREFREAVANELVSNMDLLREVVDKPEKLIELCFVVVDKNQKTLPFMLNAVQKDFINRLNQAKEDYKAGRITEISMLVLKGRQQGFTTLITAYQLACSILNKNFQGFTLSDKSDNSEAIFQNKAKFTYYQLPDTLRPTEKFNNRKQFLFEKINSSWSVDTATKDVGRSRTINFFHGSECAFWKDGIVPIQAGLGEAFTKDCIKIYESTANGYNDYQSMWESGAHINCFYEWWKTSEYQINIINEEEKEQFIKNIDTKNEWIWERLRWLRDEIHLKLEQLYWYYKKWKGYIDKELIKQEYPCSAEEAFLLPGKNVFDTEAILKRLAQLKKPLKIGYFTYDYDGQRLSNIKWVNDRNGYIRIYQVPNAPRMTKYCIGGDTAGEGSDSYTGHVLDAKTGEQVATLKRQFDPDIYARQMYCLGMYYGYALISIEANFDTYPIRELQRLGYENQYVREDLDEYTKKPQKHFGFKTTSITRPTIIAKVIEIVRDFTELLNDEDTLRELMKIIRNEKGRIEAPVGGHDDQMMGLAIAYQAIEQVIFNEEPIISRQTQFIDNQFEKLDMYKDYGENIEVI